MGLGISFGFRYPNAGRDIAALGATWVREIIAWGQVEPNAVGAPDWIYYDALLGSFRRIKQAVPGARVILTVRAKSDWAGKIIVGAQRSATRPPASIGRYESFLRQLRDRSAGLVDVWQIENECDWANYWAGSAAEYLALVSAACGVVGPEAVALCGWTSSTTEEASGCLPIAHPRMVAFARYVMENRPMMIWADAHCYGATGNVAAQLLWLGMHIDNSRILCTELGPPSRLAGKARLDDLEARLRAAGEHSAAALWFLLRDTTAPGIPPAWQHNGLVEETGARKPEFATFQAVAKGL